MKFHKLTVTYADDFLDWQLGDEHEVNPIRSLLATEKLKHLEDPGICEIVSDWGQSSVVEKAKWERAMKSIQPEKVEVRKASGLWEPELAMFGATYYLTEKILKNRVFDGSAGIYFNPAGGEHSESHADVDVINDLAWACLRMQDAGLRVAYIDWDAHHCYETETLLRGSGVLTFSVHERSTAATTYSDLDGEGFVNYGMEQGASDWGLINAVAEILDTLEGMEPFDVIVLNAGADGLEEDPTSGMDWTIDGYGVSSKMLGEFAAGSGASVLVGGGGSTLPIEGCPEIWSAVLSTLTLEMVMVGAYDPNLELLP